MCKLYIERDLRNDNFLLFKKKRNDNFLYDSFIHTKTLEFTTNEIPTQLPLFWRQ